MAAWPLVTFLVIPTPTSAETAIQGWVQRYSARPNGYAANANDFAIDSSDNVIVTGYRTVTAGYADYATIKYSIAGAALWTNYYNGPGNRDDEAMAVAVDSQDNVIVTGYSASTSATPINYDYATIKYSSAGVPLWTNRYNGPGNSTDWAIAVVVDTNDDIVVTGRSYASTTSLSSDYATIKYSSAGVPLWTNRYNGPGGAYSNDEATAVALDSNNDVVVTGHSAGASSTASDYATVKYSSAGVPLWTNRYHGTASGGATAYAVAVDGDNNVIVTGGAANSSARDYATIKYSGMGVPLWTNLYDGPVNSDDQANAVVVDGNGDVLVTGYSTGTGYHTDYATIKYSGSGGPLWTNRYSGPAVAFGDDVAAAVVVDGSNNVVVTGSSPAIGGDPDYATVKYSSSGVALWTNRYSGGYGNNYAQQVKVDHHGDVIVSGSSMGLLADYEFATIKYVFPLMITGCEMTNGTFQVQLDNVRNGSLVIEASTNLAGWLPIFTNTAPTNVLFYTDPDAGSYPGRFYRAFQSP
jgi:uncharacterized delta-60 repeat protein